MRERMLLVFVAVVMLVGCGVRKNSNTVNTANGHQNCTWTAQGWDCNRNSKQEFADCMSRVSTMGSAHADAYCRCVTDGGTVVPSQNPAIPPTCVAPGASMATMPGAMPGYGGYGYGSPGMVRTCLPGSPACAPAIIPDQTPYGAVAMERSSGGARIYVVPGATSASSEDVENLTRASKANRDAICRTNPKDPMCCPTCGGR